MKKPISGILIFYFAIAFAHAQKIPGAFQQSDFKYGSIITTSNKEITEYRFNTLQDLINGIDEISKELTFPKAKNSKEHCEISVGVKIELADGNSKMIISGCVTTFCNENEVSNAVQKLKAFLPEVL